MNWDYLQPVKIHFGKGRVKEIKEIVRELGCERGLLVAGPFFFKSGFAEKVIKESEGMIVASFGDVSPNPGRCRGRCLCGSDPAEKYRICGSTGWRQSHGLCQSSCQCSSDSGFHP